MARTRDHKPVIVGSRALWIINRRLEGCALSRANRNLHLGDGLTVSLVLCGPGKPAVGFQSKLPTARLRSGVSNRRNDPVRLCPQGCHCEIGRGRADIDNVNLKPLGEHRLMSIVPAGLLQVGDDDEAPSCPVDQVRRLVEERGVSGAPIRRLDSAERGTCRSRRAGLGDDLGPIVECNDSDSLARFRVVDNRTRAAQRLREPARRIHAEGAVQRDDQNPGRRGG